MAKGVSNVKAYRKKPRQPRSQEKVRLGLILFYNRSLKETEQ